MTTEWMGGTLRSGETRMSQVPRGCVLLGTLQQSPSRSDPTLLTDVNFIVNLMLLTEMPSEASQKVGAGVRWRGLRTKV